MRKNSCEFANVFRRRIFVEWLPTVLAVLLAVCPRGTTAQAPSDSFRISAIVGPARRDIHDYRFSRPETHGYTAAVVLEIPSIGQWAYIFAASDSRFAPTVTIPPALDRAGSTARLTRI